MSKVVTYINPQVRKPIRIVVVKTYSDGAQAMFLAHKEGATSSKYVFGVAAKDCVSV